MRPAIALAVLASVVRLDCSDSSRNAPAQTSTPNPSMIAPVALALGVSVGDFGAVGDGIADDTVAIQAALDAAAPPGPGVVVVPTPAAFYAVSRPLRLPNGVAIRGEMRTSFIGPYVQVRPRIQKTSTAPVGIRTFEAGTVVQRDAIFYTDPDWSPPSGGAPDGFYPTGFEIAGLSIRGSDATSTIAVYFEQGSRLYIHDSDISGVRHAFYGRNVWGSSFERTRSTGRWDVEVGGTSLKFDQVSSGGSTAGFDGFHLRGVSNSTFLGTTSDDYSQTAYEFTRCRGIVLVAPGAESGVAADASAGSMFAFRGQNVVTVIGAFSHTKAASPSPIVSAEAGDLVTFMGSDFSSFAGPAQAVVDVAAGADARVTFVESVFTDGSNGTPRVTFDATTPNSAAVIVAHGGEHRTFRYGSTIDNALGSATFTAAPGTDALVIAPGARLSLGPAKVLSGVGPPEGVVTAPVGSMYLRTDGGPGSTLFVKESGSGSAGWITK